MKIYNETEKGIQTAIMQYLKYKGYYVMRMNSGRIKTENRLIKLMEAGTPDLMAFKSVIALDGFEIAIAPEKKLKTFTEMLFVEVKRKGNKPTYLQEMKMKELEEYGARCIVAHSVDELTEAGI